jgi:2-keto-4-pentenoate hydratase/2-oxohepta-3-ene-1,7-dioic acid hydratase in catechol pathway
VKLANVSGRAALVIGGGCADVEAVSKGLFSHRIETLYDRWDEFTRWATGVSSADSPLDPGSLEAPSPRPRQVFAIGLNYVSHADEASSKAPDFPQTFTKFPTCITGPRASVELPSDFVDWEVELVTVIGRRGYQVPEHAAWDCVAGLMIGQDLSERVVQMRPPMPQFSLGKSFAGFGPTGPWLVSADELDDADDLRILCRLNGEQVQSGRTSDLVFPVASLVSYLSSIVALTPGDLIFTGTPAGIGAVRKPPRYLRPGDELTSAIDGIGAISTTFRRR